MRTLITLGLLVLTTSSAYAATAAEVLAKVDKNLGNFKDETIVFQVQNMKPGSSAPQAMKFRSYVKGGKNFVEFLEPGDVKGMRILTLGPTEIYTYLPEYGRIRRVASGNLEQGFLGTTLTQADMATLSYGIIYTPTLTSETATTYLLDLVSKDPANTAYDHIRMEVEKARSVPTKIDYLAADGTVVRTQLRSKYSCPRPDYCTFGELKMTDNSRAGAWTTLTPVDLKIDSGVADDVFSQRTLQLGL